ncbi:MAG: hypothetical protein QM713_11810 [Arachnia sp.]
MEWLEEAWRNISGRQVLVGAAVVLATLLSTVLAFSQASAAVMAQRALVTSGATTWQIEPAVAGGTIPAAGCHALQGIAQVKAGGAGPARSPLYARHRSQQLSVIEITPGVLDIWPVSGAPGLVVGSDYESLGIVRQGSAVADGSSSLTEVTARLGDTHAPEELRSALLRVGRPEMLDKCWLRLEPGSESAGPQLAKWAFVNTPIVVKQFAPPTPESSSPQVAWETFVRSGLWLAPAVLALVAGLAVGMGRRRELGLIRTLGASRRDLLTLCFLEVVLLAPLYIVALSAGLLVGYFRAEAVSLEIVVISLRLGAATALLAVVVASLAVVVPNFGSAAASLRS